MARWWIEVAVMAALIAVAIAVAFRAGWSRGFERGADTALCVVWHGVEGQEAAMRRTSCRSISNVAAAQIAELWR